MAINFTDYSKAPLLDNTSPWSHLFEDALKGYKEQQEPAKMKQESQAKEYANALQKLALDHQPKAYQLDDDYKQSQIDKNNAPTESKLKPTGDVANQLFIDELEKTNPHQAAKLKAVHKAGLDQKETRALNQTRYANSIAFKALTAAEKERSIANAVGMGFDPMSASKAMTEGKDLTEMAEEKGFTLGEVNPSYALTGGEIKDNRKRNAYNAEMKSLDKNITEGLKPYISKIKGRSFDQIVDSLDELSEPTPEKQKQLGNFLAARALAPELAGLRMNVMGGKVGIEGIRHLSEVSLSTSKVLESLVDKETYQAFQDSMQKYLDEAVNSYTNYMDKDAGLGSSSKSGTTNSVFDLSTGDFVR